MGKFLVIAGGIAMILGAMEGGSLGVVALIVGSLAAIVGLLSPVIGAVADAMDNIKDVYNLPKKD